ncbi:MAG TPA: heavy metal-binding domain-containing protein, partial [Armatimonadota bacterium]|nr:heavy metal-binding domain-containing protein [Armatimonadota bacterium]
TSIIPFQGMQEMVMIGTASHHPSLPPQYSQSPISSDLTNEEMWNLIHIGYMPIQLVLGVSVYSLGFAGGITSAFKSLRRGEIPELTTLIYEARENAIGRIASDANACGADDVVGIKTYVYSLGSGVIEFMAIGTAVKRMEGIGTISPSLPAQAIIKDKDTFVNTAELVLGTNLNQGARAGI